MPAQILDPNVPYGVQRSLTGTPLDAAVPGKYYDEADMARRQVASGAESAALSNPAMNRRTPQSNNLANYLGTGLPYDYEGLLRNVAMKYGVEAAQNLVKRLPTMSRQELMQIARLVELAGSEADAMDERERMAYQRAGAPSR